MRYHVRLAARAFDSGYRVHTPLRYCSLGSGRVSRRRVASNVRMRDARGCSLGPSPPLLVAIARLRGRLEHW